MRNKIHLYDKICRYLKKKNCKENTLEKNRATAIDPRTARFYESEEIGLETGRESL